MNRQQRIFAHAFSAYRLADAAGDLSSGLDSMGLDSIVVVPVATMVEPKAKPIEGWTPPVALAPLHQSLSR
jgi:hypothetical protein